MKQVGQAQFVLQVLEEVQDLRLDRDVEGGDRFVADQEVRFQGERAGDADALALAAREGMRIAFQVAHVQAHDAQQVLDHLGPLGRVAHAVDEQRLADEIEDGHARVERAERVLEDELDAAAKVDQRLALQGQHVHQPAAVVEFHPPGVRRQRAHDDLGERGLAATAFAHQAQALASADGEAHVVDRQAGREAGAEEAPPCGW